MTKTLFRCTEYTDQGVAAGIKVKEGFINGYDVADRLLEDVPIRIFEADSGEIDADIILEPELIKSMFINTSQVRDKVLDWVKSDAFDILSSSAELNDDDICIFDDAKPLSEQAFAIDVAAWKGITN